MNRFNTQVKDEIQLIIAIDGPSGAGKGTIAKHLSLKYSLIHIDSGLFYRYVGWVAEREKNFDPNFLLRIAKAVQIDDLNKPQLKEEKTAQFASCIAVIPQVRDAITEQLRNLSKEKNVVVDGRDIGTHVFPDAEIKIFVTARPEVRHNRRSVEMQNENSTTESQLMRERDKRDQERTVAPLAIASDAYILDTSDMSIARACTAAEIHVKTHW